MNVYINGQNNEYEIEKLLRIFFPFERVDFITLRENAEVKLEFCGSETYRYIAEVTYNGKTLSEEKTSEATDERTARWRLLALLYKILSRLTGYESPWGILTGVRPAKLYGSMLKKYGETEAMRYFSEELLVSTDKIELCRRTYHSEVEIINKSDENSFSLYVGIPFCPSRCSYCSFVSHSIDKAKHLIPEYTDYLVKELEDISKRVKSLGLKLSTVYIGGGTPTTLPADELSKILTVIADKFDMSTASEFTVEAGRPDTVTAEKLSAIYRAGATRISINPQTMNDNILEFVGRRHTAKDTVSAFNLARKIGFRNINMDLIAGLPGDNFESFKNSVDSLVNLDPENITVHTLCMKRSSEITVEGNKDLLLFGSETAKMTEYAYKKLTNGGFLPYYMYRQAKMVGNLENVGYAKPGFEGLYNVYIMDETHSIIACGASAVTKLRRGNDIERIFNFKYPYEYIRRFSEQMQRKEKINEFYK